MKKLYLTLAIFGVIVNLGATLIDIDTEITFQTSSIKIDQESRINEVKSINEFIFLNHNCPPNHQSLKCILNND